MTIDPSDEKIRRKGRGRVQLKDVRKGLSSEQGLARLLIAVMEAELHDLFQHMLQ